MRRRCGLPSVVLGLALRAAPALALTPPTGGAVAFPSGVRLTLPFPAGSRIRVASGYSPSGGSSLHDGTNRASFANDYYALDLVYDGRADGGLGLPVVAPLRGTVVRAGWATSGWANYGQRVILRHDLGDGQVYHTIYCHLNAIDSAVREGATVEVGQTLGQLGRSCQGALSCASFSGAHTHWAIHRGSTIGGSGTGGSYGGVAVVPEPFDGAENLRQGTVITSTTGSSGPPPPPPPTPPRCAPIPSAGRVIDETDPCFTRGGSAMYWYTASAGYAGALLWTHATSAAAADDYGLWTLSFERAGDYQLDAYTAAGYGASQRAAYQVAHDGRTERVVVDQSRIDGWTPIGRLHFAAGGGQSVRLDDNTGEAFSTRTRLAFDALRLVPALDAGTPDAATAMDVTRTDTALPDAPSRLDAREVTTDLEPVDHLFLSDLSLPPDVTASRDAAMPIDAPRVPVADASTPEEEGRGVVLEGAPGCACRAQASARTRWCWALALPLLLIRRRRAAPKAPVGEALTQRTDPKYDLGLYGELERLLQRRLRSLFSRA